MNRLALAVASVAAVVVLTVALAAGGFAPAKSAVLAAGSQAVAPAAPSATGSVQTVEDPVYVAPAPTPKVIHRVLPAPSPRIVTVAGPAAGSAEHEHEGSERDGGGGDD